MTPAIASHSPQPPPAWVHQALVFADVVESVRLLRDHPTDFVSRWSAFVDEVRTDLLPARGGRLVKSYGDGFLLAFDHVSSAAAAALELNRRIARYNQDRPPDAIILLRGGVNVGLVVAVDGDLVGDAVNLAQRICALADPGAVLASADARDVLVAGIDPDAEDLGLRYVKHVDEPIRIYRLGPAAGVRLPVLVSSMQLKPGVAVIPYVGQLGADPAGVIGDALADDLTAELARCADLHVISGLSARMLKGRSLGLAEMAGHLGASYLVTGRYRQHGDGLRVHIELVEVRDAGIVWTDTCETSVHDAFDPAAPLAARVATPLVRAVLNKEFTRAMTLPLPSLEAYSLMIGALGLLHRLSPSDFARARQMLEHLCERLGRNAVPHAWLAKWHVLRNAQGWSPSPADDAARAQDHVQRALDIDPRNALALSVGGLVHSYMRKDHDRAARMYEEALSSNPNEPLARLFSSVLCAWRGQTEEAAAEGGLALRLCPLDPMHYFFDSLAATALVGGPHVERAVELSQRSLRANRTHASTWRTLAFGLARQGRMDEARAAVEELRAIEPHYTVSEFWRRFPGADGPLAAPWAQALAEAGLPP